MVPAPMQSIGRSKPKIRLFCGTTSHNMGYVYLAFTSKKAVFIDLFAFSALALYRFAYRFTL